MSYLTNRRDIAPFSESARLIDRRLLRYSRSRNIEVS
jgi:hypothetical protein